MSFSRLKEKVTEHLIQNHNRYIQYHEDSADRLVYEATNFFNDAAFTLDVVDVLIKATADALNIRLKIYRRSPAGNIQCQIIESDNPTMDVMLEFCSPQGVPATYTGANHYNSVTKIDPTTNLRSRNFPSGNNPTEEENNINQTPLASSSSSSPTGSVVFDEMRDVEDQETLDFEINRILGNSTSAIPDFNELEINGESGQQLVEMYLRPGTVFPEQLFKGITPKCVEYLPHNINGNKYFKVKCSPKDLMKKVQDRRWFYMRTSSKTGLRGIRKVGTCQGSWECINPNCSFLSTEGKANWWHFEYRHGCKCCYSCGTFAQQIPCGARKLVQFSFGSEFAHVYHIGNHTCTLQQQLVNDTEYTKKWVKKYPGMSFKRLKTTVIQVLMDSGDLEGAQEAAYKITNKAYMRNRRQEGNVPEEVSTQSIEAVAEMKKGSDKLDKLHIFRLNNSSMNSDPDYVCKSSSKILQMALDMDQDGEPNCLQDEDVFFDGSHSRCTDFISLGLWVYHPSMRSVVRLVSMEVRSESTETLTIFWSLVNEMLQIVGKKGDSYKFNPRNIMTDEAGAHFAAMRNVFGDEFVNKKCITCQWHFLNSVNEKIHKIGEEYQEEFLEKAILLCNVKTVAEFELCFARLKEIATMFPEVGNFLDWYYARRIHLFPAFRKTLHSGLNLAEVGNAKWKKEMLGQTKLSLVASAKNDINTMLQQEADYVRFREGDNFSRGRGPTDMQRAAAEKRFQMEQGRAFGQMLSNQAALEMQMACDQDPPYFMPNRGAKHKPGRKTKSVEGRSGKRKSSTPATLNELLEKLNSAKQVEVQANVSQEATVNSDGIQLGKGPEPRPVRPIPSTPRFPNPPLVTQSFFNITICHGCPYNINSKDLTPPNDLLIKLKAVRPYMDARTRFWVDKVANVYFHLSLPCLQNFDPTLKIEDISMTNEMFCQIGAAHVQHLRNIGFLDHIVKKIENNIQQVSYTNIIILFKAKLSP